MRIHHTTLGAALAALVLTACAAHGGNHHGAHWGYEGESGPAHWGAMSEEFALCETGKAQSPIDIDPQSAAAEGKAAISLDYQAGGTEVINNGHTIQVNFQPGSTMSVGADKFDLLQLHFHHTSEHTVGGKSFPMEMHLVHKSKDGTLAVLGVLISEGEENAAIAPVWAAIPGEAGGKAPLASPISAASLLPASMKTYRYSGSLTTPPCSEGVRWHVLSESIAFSKAQIDAFASHYSVNNRPVQARNERAPMVYEN
ncbi:MAG: carbonic anhydrase family protein [Chrysiogenetes bacterium]|nr:carbonic anhydrase family protein [Chrysiogenetes bacterium]